MTLRPVEDADIERLVEIVNEPEVARWWGSHDVERLRGELLGAPDVASFAIETGRELIGVVLYHEEPEPDYRHAGLDISLSTRHQGAGLGPEALRVLARHLIDDRGHHRLTIDPAAANERAIRAYERVGFRRVGIMRRYERGPDGAWRDGLLMDLLAAELR